MRHITGDIQLPANQSDENTGLVLVEVRDVTLMDVASIVLVEQRLADVALSPNGRVHFDIPVPEVEANRSLILRIHISRDGSGQVKSGDLLTTINYSVPTKGSFNFNEVKVSRI